MPQTFLVVQCFCCNAFQSKLETKAKQWQCKVCGEKQSLQRVFARSHSNKDCRQVVQRYNSVRGQLEEDPGPPAQYDDGGSGDARYGEEQEEHQAQQQQQRWQAFKDENEVEDGWTVAMPERQAPAERGGGHAGSGGKRQRRQQDSQPVRDTTAVRPHHHAQPQQQQWAQQGPLAGRQTDGVVVPRSNHSWGGGKQLPAYAPSTAPTRQQQYHQPPAAHPVSGQSDRADATQQQPSAKWGGWVDAADDW